jgi:hypothetical protein
VKYMLLINSSSTGTDEGSFEDWQLYDKAVKGAGIFVDGQSLADLTTATSVRVGADGERVVATDGPFAETREVLVPPPTGTRGNSPGPNVRTQAHVPYLTATENRT